MAHRLSFTGAGLLLLLSASACEPGDDPGDCGCGGQGGSEASSGDAAGESALVDCPAGTSPFAVRVVSHSFGPGQDFGQVCATPEARCFPESVLGAPRGGGLSAGGLDVVSLGEGGEVVLAFDAAIVDGPGPDFLVFENAFAVDGDPAAPFAELGVVAVSEDGKTWHDFPCTAAEYPYGDCAGWRPVLATETGGEDPTDPEEAGGDAFDLATLGLDSAVLLRVTDLPGDDAVFDLDAVAIVHGRCGPVP
jgi:hypothetical protein